jgi:hypothetical protein
MASRLVSYWARPRPGRKEMGADDGEDRDAESEDETLSRRTLFQRLGGYSVAVMSLLGGGALSAGCGDDDDGGSGRARLCTNTCSFASDGDCDDGGEGSDYSLCEFGTDCDDCGPRRSGYSDTYSDYSNAYSNYSNAYSNYSNAYSNYSNYSNYYNTYYNYSNYVYYYNYFVNSW